MPAVHEHPDRLSAFTRGLDRDDRVAGGGLISGRHSNRPHHKQVPVEHPAVVGRAALHMGPAFRSNGSTIAHLALNRACLFMPLSLPGNTTLGMVFTRNRCRLFQYEVKRNAQVAKSIARRTV